MSGNDRDTAFAEDDVGLGCRGAVGSFRNDPRLNTADVVASDL
jgi:hypothetical protein